MSFMFKPYGYTDPDALNRPEIPARIAARGIVSTEKIAEALSAALPVHGVLLLDGYVSANFALLNARIEECFAGRTVAFFDVSSAYKSPEEMEKMLAESLPEDREIDPILLFGKCVHREIESLFDTEKTAELVRKIEQAKKSADLVVVSGCGSAFSGLRSCGDIAAFLDVTPLEVTLRIRARKTANLGDGANVRPLPQVLRRMYYYDYEIMMQHRQNLIDKKLFDYYIDGNRENFLKMLPIDSFREILRIQLDCPFRCTPVYLEGVWGGTFVKHLRHLPDDMRNCAWVFDMIPNEVSVQIKAGKHTFNIPFSTIFRTEPEKLMGPESVTRFGRIFPIRFNYDDTYNGNGNMSIQVHPSKAYNQAHFGEPFQQDESYYCVKTAGSKTYLGLRDECDTDEFFACIDRAEKEHIAFDHDKYVNSFPSTEGDQFLLPGGTIHASGRNQIVLEIGSYTIGSYTFKLYDYLRKDLDGTPRPIHSIHGKNVLVTDRRRSSVDGVLRPKPRTVREGEGWKEEIVGEHDLIYFSLRRLSFDRSVSDDTKGEKFHVLVLVKGEAVLIYAKANPEHCYHAKYMDMVVVPASLGAYGILNLGKEPCQVTKTMLK
ncbi:MAG: class I mannose-6-phosphate isomerase [Victivallaceae bacterium]|nr:class I mannose-6-phosphate isomerase [Victivallaceae bacterium]